MNTFLKILLLPLIIFLYTDKSNCLNGNDLTPEIIELSTLKDSIRYYYYRGDYEKSVFFARKTRDHTIKYSLSDELVKSLRNLAIQYYYNWDFDSALYALSSAEKTLLKSESIDLGYLGRLYFDFGRIKYTEGNLIIAEQYYEKAIEYLSQLDEDPYITWLLYVYLYQSQILVVNNNLSSALDYLSRSYKIVQNKVKNKDELLVLYYNYASVTYERAGLFDEFLLSNRKALEISLKDSVNNIFHLAVLYNNLGTGNISINNFSKAQYYLDISLNLYKSLGFKGSYLGGLYNNYGKLFEKKNDYHKALTYYQMALQYLVDEFSDEDYLKNPNLENIAAKLAVLDILKSKSACLHKLFLEESDFKYLDAALSTSQLAIRIIEDLRTSYQTFESKLRLAELENITFKNGLAISVLAYQVTNKEVYARTAFEISEKTKSAILLSSLRELNAKKFGEIPEYLLAQEKRITKKIEFYKENIYEEEQNAKPDSSKLNMWKNYLFDFQRQHEELIKKFETEYPNYYSLKYDNSVVSSAELSKSLKRGSTVLEYVISDSALYTFVVSNSKFKLHIQHIDETFFIGVNEFLNEYQKFDFSKQSLSGFTSYCWNSKALYDILIKPMKSDINGKHIIIIPDDILSYVPFETLIQDLPNTDSKGYFRDLDYLLNDYQISYSYSSTLLKQVSQKQKGKIKKLLAFAPEYGNGSMNQIDENILTTRQKYRKDLQPIPGVIDEVNAIHSLIASDLYIGKKATESKFREIAKNYDILHLAMHTIVDNQNPMFSKLVFTHGEDSLNDGLLNTHEIFSLKLKAKLVVLSACSTAEGDYKKGEGVLSLARGFVYAGSPSLLMTMWQVEDKSSVQLMINYYKKLLKGQSKAEALRNAKLDFIKTAKPENTHPFFWSSFVLMGNNSPLFQPGKPYIVLLFAATLIIVFFLIRRKKGE
ncbi:MAG: CHAT domain-containing protein [Bacteroidales bacterium]|nr:CHAT domain-containing protein [Bacteroidales bacterium]